jgi:rhodanese-related sulfurtransferase
MNSMEIDVATTSRWLKAGHNDESTPMVLVDCREPHESEIARIEGAVLMPMSQWPPSETAISQLNGKAVVVHCHHGGRSMRVAQWFRQNGHPSALSMAGGIDAWSNEIDDSIARY